MKQNVDIVHLILIMGIIVCIYFMSTSAPTFVERVQYIKGDSVIVETVKIESVFVDRWLEKADTVNITDTSCFASTEFNIEEDSVSVSGIVTFVDSSFNFNNILVKYPEITKTITRIDTILQTVDAPFYKNSWFWGFLAVVTTVLVFAVGGIL